LTRSGHAGIVAPMSTWDLWKKGFEAWEQATAEYLDTVMRNEAVLEPSGAMLAAAMKMKTASDKALTAWWGGIGLPTKRDQERALHRINQLESRILDLEEELVRAREEG
jgi:hypothetical protein